MDEYIKREDALDAVLFALVGTGNQSRAIYAIRDVPTVDVVSKSEVMKLVGQCYDKCDECRTKCANSVAKEIFEEIDRLIHKVLNDEHYIMGDMVYDIAELKKKYTEGK